MGTWSLTLAFRVLLGGLVLLNGQAPTLGAWLSTCPCGGAAPAAKTHSAGCSCCCCQAEPTSDDGPAEPEPTSAAERDLARTGDGASEQHCPKCPKGLCPCSSAKVSCPHAVSVFVVDLPCLGDSVADRHVLRPSGDPFELILPPRA